MRRLAEALTQNPASGADQEVLALLVAAAGSSLAPESAYPDKVNARRERRQRRQREDTCAGLVEDLIDARTMQPDGVVEHFRHRRWISRYAFRETEATRFIPSADLPMATRARGGNLNLLRRREWPDGTVQQDFAPPPDWRLAKAWLESYFKESPFGAGDERLGES